MIPYPPNAGQLPKSMKDLDVKEPEDNRYMNKEFSRQIVKHIVEEYKQGKYTEKYIKTYLDFVHLEGIVDNLEYLHLKNELFGEIKNEI